ILAELLCALLGVQLEPVVMEGQAAVVVADAAKAVYVAGPDAAPVDELDAELERAAHGAHEFHLVDAQRVIEGAQVRHRGFAHPDGADVLGLDELNRYGKLQGARQRGRGHPARGSAPDDDDALEPRVVAHESYCGTNC